MKFQPPKGTRDLLPEDARKLQWIIDVCRDVFNEYAWIQFNGCNVASGYPDEDNLAQRVADYFEKKLDAFNNLVPMLESVEKKKLQITGLRFIETLHELKKFYNDVLDEYKNKEYFIIGSAPGWEGLDPEWFTQFRKKRGHANIKTRLLLSAESAKINPEDPKLLRIWKYLPAKHKFKSTIDIFKDKILIVSPELSSLAVVVAIPAMVDVFKSVFEIIWDSLHD